jgi:hypothetical protein
MAPPLVTDKDVAHMEKDEDATNVNQTGQGSGHVLCGEIGEDQRREDAKGFEQNWTHEFF